jgi:preprotein translocase subunit SecA
MSIFEKIFGDPNEKILKKIQPTVDEINSFEESVKKLSDDELKQKTEEFRATLEVAGSEYDEIKFASEEDKKELREKLDKILPEAYAVVREASWRVKKQRHYDVQLIGGIVLHRGQIGEMKTGEGKTLVATLPLYLNALTKLGVQLVTVNDYLSRMGAGLNAPIFAFLGLTTGVIVHEAAYIYDPEYIDDSQYDENLKNFRPITRKEAYACDVLYGTNNEFGFDHLRDNMAPSVEKMVQRGFYFAVVDEIDSILIDEARTPLIISAPAEESTDRYYKFAELVRRLKENDDYNIDEKMKSSTLTEAGIEKMENWLGVENIYTERGIREVHHIEQALKAHALFARDKDYVVQEDEVIIVDEFTGRMMHGRRYSEGLHQAIEAKENVKIQRESQTLASITFQNYFRMYSKLAGMTGTAVTEAEEFAKIYSLEVVVIPTNKPIARNDMNDLIYKTEDGKFMAVINNVRERSEAGQPILVGTISIEKNEKLIAMMEREGMHPQVLNAKNHEKEAKIIAQAGKPGSITIATNMAGRGVDIMLGGTEPSKDSDEYSEWKKNREIVVGAGGLHVVGTERHESRRIDNQLRGRSGRQGDVGTTQFYVSMDDDLMRIFGGDRMKSIMTTLKVPEDMPIDNKLISRSIESAQKKVEGNNFDTRKHLVEYDDVINKHREAIYTERLNILKLSEKAKDDDSARDELSDIILTRVENEIEQTVSFHTAAEYIKDWDLNEIYQVISTIFPVTEKLKTDLSGYIKNNEKLDKVKARTAIIDHLLKMARDIYSSMQKSATDAGIEWVEAEKSVMIRSTDTLWVEHLEAMSSVRQGIGLRGYGQRDPLVEYKKEAYRLFNELNSLIQREVVYSIYKVGMLEGLQGTFKSPTIADRAAQYSAPEKTAVSNSSSFSGFKQRGGGDSSSSATVDMVKQKVKNDDGTKVGRNDPCPCGSGKKFKKCCGK